MHEKQLKERLEKKEKEIRDMASAKARGNQALQKERTLAEEKRSLEEEIR